MNETKKLRLRLDLATLPGDWRLSTVCVDWDGEPLVLFEQGKPPAPPRNADIHAIVSWMNAPAEAHYLMHWANGAADTIRFDNLRKLTLTLHVQQFGDGWLLGEARGGFTRITNKNGNTVRTLDLGDASKHVQTTPDGHIWVGYFDEGVFGSGIGQSGLVCFDANGNPVFKYSELARQEHLPDIADCYALNVVDDSAWVCYYTDFPLVQLRSFRVERVWAEFGPTRAIAIRDAQFVRFPAYSKPFLVTRSFETQPETTWELEAPDGSKLSVLSGSDADIKAGHGAVTFRVAARGRRVYVYDEHGVYEVP